jgi:hypothetical protein
MVRTYDRWIHHGEPLCAEHGPEAHHAEHGPEAHHAEHVKDVSEVDGGLEEEDEFEDDRVPNLFEDLYRSEPQDGMNSIFSQLIEEVKRASVAGGKLSRFSFTMKLLHIKSV